jgi:hypothetical protein
LGHKTLVVEHQADASDIGGQEYQAAHPNAVKGQVGQLRPVRIPRVANAVRAMLIVADRA